MRKVLLFGHDDHDSTLLLVKENFETKFSSKTIVLDTRQLGGANFISHNLHVNKLDSQIITSEGRFSLQTFNGIWCRRWEVFLSHDELLKDEYSQYNHENTYHQMSGLFNNSTINWVNNPIKHKLANNKILQLQLAQKLNLQIPDTLITNNKDDALQFIQNSKGSVICKKLSDHPSVKSTKTVLLKNNDIQFLDLLSNCPVIIQEEIPVDRDVRVIVIGENIFAAEVETRKGKDPIDWRVDVSNPWKAHNLDTSIASALIKLNKALGLVYSAIDLRLTPSGQYYYFETNPGGQFLFLEVWTSMKIMDCLCDTILTRQISSTC
ncbi:MAG: hypothetical protein JSS76_03750 [Bacteroidetes bacterium]|nr:hypothetical protein [Bacteroidota bacterium]